MNVEQAITVIDQLVAGCRGTRTERETLESAFRVLTAAATRKRKIGKHAADISGPVQPGQ